MDKVWKLIEELKSGSEGTQLEKIKELEKELEEVEVNIPYTD